MCLSAKSIFLNYTNDSTLTVFRQIACFISMNKICDNMCLKWGDEVGLAKQKSFCKKRKMQNSAASSLLLRWGSVICEFRVSCQKSQLVVSWRSEQKWGGDDWNIFPISRSSKLLLLCYSYLSVQSYRCSTIANYNSRVVGTYFRQYSSKYDVDIIIYDRKDWPTVLIVINCCKFLRPF